jgi:AcrR family transcriptional regulator
MPRTVPPDRFDSIIRAATRVFLEQGYRRTQMADVAEALGLAKGTLYLYVESKEALFEQVMLHADRSDPIPPPARLPVPTPKPGTTLRTVRGRLQQESALPSLAAALGRRRAAADSKAELEGILLELHRLLASHRIGIKLIDRCAADYPELAVLWFGEARGGVMALLEQYLEARIAGGQLPAVEDVVVSSRLVLETCVFWAVHRHFDRAPQDVSDEVAEAAVIQFVSRALRGG